MIKYKLIKEGAKADIYSILDDESEVFGQFLLSIEERYQKKIVSLISFLSTVGVINNNEKYKSIGKSDVIELKAQPYRLLTHKIETKTKYKYIILSGFKKPAKKKQSREIEKAKKLSSEIIAGNALEIK